MKRKVILAIVIALPLLTAACNTFEGLGQDVSKGGQNLESAAERNK